MSRCTHNEYSMLYDDDFCACKICEQTWSRSPQGKWVPEPKVEDPGFDKRQRERFIQYNREHPKPKNLRKPNFRK